MRHYGIPEKMKNFDVMHEKNEELTYLTMTSYIENTVLRLGRHRREHDALFVVKVLVEISTRFPIILLQSSHSISSTSS